MTEMQNGARPDTRFSSHICVFEPRILTMLDRSGLECGNPLQANKGVGLLSKRIKIPNSHQPEAGLET